MSAHRTSLSIYKPLYDAGLEMMKHHRCSNYSDYVSMLIRDDVARTEERRTLATTSTVLAEDPAAYGTSNKGRKQGAA